MNTTIRTRLIYASSLAFLLIFSSFFYIILKLSTFNKQLREIVDVNVERIALAHNIIFEIESIAIAKKNIIIESELPAIAEEESAINNSRIKLNNNLAKLEEISSEAGKLILHQFKDVWKDYNVELRNVVELKKQGNVQAAYELSLSKTHQLRSQLVDLIDQIIKLNKARMESEKSESDADYRNSILVIIAMILIILLFTSFLSVYFIRLITGRIKDITEGANKIASRELSEISFKEDAKDELAPITHALKDILYSFREITQQANEIAKGNYSISITPKSENDLLGNSLKEMAEALYTTSSENNKRSWIEKGINLLNEKLSGEKSIEQISNDAICFLSEYTGANIGALYRAKNQNEFVHEGRYAFSSSDPVKRIYTLNEGLIGQVAASGKPVHLSNLEGEDLRISSSIIDTHPRYLLIMPFFFNNRVLGVIELGKLDSFAEQQLEFIDNALDIVGINLNSALNRERIQNLLDETQAQSEELQVQQEELKQVNEELEEHTRSLKYQQEELQVANEELEEHSKQLKIQNEHLEAAKEEIEKKSLELEMSSRYKSQFLANMSHELRTPLNSLLILSKDLAENRKHNLDAEQIESANIIYKSGKDLLQLINEILDLSKIEAGKMDLNINKIDLGEFAKNIKRNFSHIAREKGLRLFVNTDPSSPKNIYSDHQRLDQIIKNLLSNAIKFTEVGSVTVNFKMASNQNLAIEVKDSGIGISEEKHSLIFEAFQQADGGISRKHGGSGLGLSISKELARLLGGEITLKSRENEGSIFTLTIPVSRGKKETSYGINNQDKSSSTIISKNEAYLNYPAIPDDRDVITEKDKTLLIIEDDSRFAEILKKQAKEKGFKVLIASTGEDGLALAEKYKPKAIILDLVLPGIQGRAVLNELKGNVSLRHIPVYVFSINEVVMDVIAEGAIDYITKPVEKEKIDEVLSNMEKFLNKKLKNLLIIEDDESLRLSVKKLIGNNDVNCIEASTGKEALEKIKKNDIDCIILDLGLPDISGIELLRKLQELEDIKIPPVIINTGKELTKDEHDELQEFSESIIIKGVKSEERLLDETSLFLHRAISDLSPVKKYVLSDMYNKEIIFDKKKVLVADDDMRNVFALSKVLKDQGMEIIKAKNGQKAIEALHHHDDISIVLMDIMMPVMDGLEAIKRIRSEEKYKDLPIIAITAKAMKEDRAKCMAAGANDYISKPIEVERLLSLMRTWINK